MYTHARKNPSELSDTYKGVNGGTSEHEYARHRPKKPRRGSCCFSHAAQHGLQATPLARPGIRRVFHAYCVPPAVAFKEVASGALEAQRWAAEKGHASFHGGANQKNQPQILYTHARKRLSEPSERDRGVNRCTPEYEIARPNN